MYRLFVDELFVDELFVDRPFVDRPFVVAGVDEVGRGPLIGSVVAAAVVLHPHRPVHGLLDSKKLSEARREELDVVIREQALGWAIAEASPEEIDDLNILHASLLAMKRAIEQLSEQLTGRSAAQSFAQPSAQPSAQYPIQPSTQPSKQLSAQSGGQPGTNIDLVLVDGNRSPDLSLPCQPIVKGDQHVQSISAASIIAKVARDRAMTDLHRLHPQFGLDQHKGYPTPMHRDAIMRHGVLPEHRRSFKPVRLALESAGTVCHWQAVPISS